MDSLVRYAWLAVAAALVTIALKLAAWSLTGSVGFLSDAAESVVNLVAAVVAVLVVRWSAAPPDEEHPFGHGKAEYFAAAAEGALIMLAAVSIVWAAVGRLIDPEPLERVGIGLVLSLVAAAVNLLVARVLLEAGRRHRSMTLEADGTHLMTDVWTSVGVVVGVALVWVTGWERLDPIVALLVAANIVISGAILIHRSSGGLMDRALPASEVAAIEGVLAGLAAHGAGHHALRTRRSGRRAFVSVHVLVPGDWSVQRGHDLLEKLEADIDAVLPHATVTTHLEPLEDPISYDDTGLDRSRRSP